MTERVRRAAWEVTPGNCRRLRLRSRCSLPRPGGRRLCDDLRERIGDRLGHCRIVQAEPVCEPGDLSGHVGRGHGRDDRRGSPQGVDLTLGKPQPPAPPVHLRVGDQIGQWVSPVDDRGEGRRDIGGDRSDRLGRLVQDPVEDRREVLPPEGLLKRQQLVGEHSDREDVGPAVQRLSPDLLRGEIRGSPERDSGLRQARLGLQRFRDGPPKIRSSSRCTS